MMKQLIPAVLLPFLFLLVACGNEGPFVNHGLKAEKAGACTGAGSNYNMVSNTSGQRYTFEQCLPDGFKDTDCTVTRRGDTILVAFPAVKAGQAAAMYKLTLDIDANPRYNFIQLSDELIAVVTGNY